MASVCARPPLGLVPTTTISGDTKLWHILLPMLAEVTKARRERIGEAAFIEEGEMVLNKTVHLGNGSYPAFHQLCPNYDVNRLE